MYRKGYRFENYLTNKLLERGYYAVRVAGSGKGKNPLRRFFDIIAVDKSGNVYGIQCKVLRSYLYTPKYDKRLAEEIWNTYGILPLMAIKHKDGITWLNMVTEKEIKGLI